MMMKGQFMILFIVMYKVIINWYVKLYWCDLFWGGASHHVSVCLLTLNPFYPLVACAR